MLVYWEEFYCIEEAKEWERYLKTSAGRRYIKGVINGGRRKVVTG